MKRFLIGNLLIFLSLISLSGCKDAPVLPEVAKAKAQEHVLWKAGAELYAPEDYRSYMSALKNGRDLLIAENARFVLFRDYAPVQEKFRGIIEAGERVEEKIRIEKDNILKVVTDKTLFLNDRIRTMRRLSSFINEGRVSGQFLTRAEILLGESRILLNKEDYFGAEDKLEDVSKFTELALEVLTPILSRYSDEAQIKKWRAWVHETIQTSKDRDIYSIVVSKIDKKLIVYKKGRPFKTYDVGIGINGSKDKMYAGDRATPEGKYSISLKTSRTRFYKALHINYPNDEDQKQFHMLKKKGIIPKTASIGNLIEIHGGGKNAMTYGCVSMENAHMDELFKIIDVGTPIAIVGSVEYGNIISSAMKEL